MGSITSYLSKSQSYCIPSQKPHPHSLWKMTPY
ncbi:unnamed protein product [Spirodela intermedia]|uniref:Uncharacterized protein n=1 Tax=Spirodela intermedia TaxID=51605 RepID=A0A7I8JHW0_SPIIN|nr:unnamed protein product [Spirodela intermedia]CAA6669736.1 unnamed protein product [Spirodela intermedia]